MGAFVSALEVFEKIRHFSLETSKVDLKPKVP